MGAILWKGTLELPSSRGENVKMASDKKTLCKWKSDDIEKDQKKFRKLIEDAKYFCRKCGRSAASKSNLCKPTGL